MLVSDTGNSKMIIVAWTIVALETLAIIGLCKSINTFNQKMSASLKNGEYIFVDGRIYKCEHIPDPPRAK